MTLPATYGSNCIETNDCTYVGTGCGTYDGMGCDPSYGCDPSGDPSCADYSCVDGSGCGLCYTMSCEVTSC